MSYKPHRTFNGVEGQPSRDTMGPEQISHDIDELCKMFDPNATHSGGAPGGITTDNMSLSGLDINDLGGIASTTIKAFRVSGGLLEYSTDGTTYLSAEHIYVATYGTTTFNQVNIQYQTLHKLVIVFYNDRVYVCTGYKTVTGYAPFYEFTNVSANEVKYITLSSPGWADIGLPYSNVNLNDLAPKSSPTFTGSPKAPTPPEGDNSTRLATTEYVDRAAVETDPTVPTWAKAPTKPTYTATEVGALPNTTNLSVYMQKGVDYVIAGQKSGRTLGDKATAEGYDNIASGYLAHAEGYQTNATGLYSHAEGYGSAASGSNSHAEGRATTATGTASHAEGYGSTASMIGAHAEGYNATASGDYSHAEGSNTTASGTDAHAEGSSTVASSYSSHAEGYQTNAEESASHAEGILTVASNQASHAEGIGTVASGYASHAEGLNTIANHMAQHVFGEYNVADANAATTGRGDYVEIVGNGTSSNRSNARTLDWSGNEVLAGTLTVGADPTNNMDVATKQYVDDVVSAFTESDPTVPSWAKASSKPSYTAQEVGALPSSTVIPSKTSDLQNDSGFITSSSLGGYMVKGVDYVTAGKAFLATLGTNATAEGTDTYASGNNSHAEGFTAKATGLASHAEGYLTTASGNDSHAEGYGTVASERTAHAEGYETTASGMDSHAEGFQTISSGRAAHAEGLITTASGSASYAGGHGTIANHAYQHVFGDHNIPDPSVQTSGLRGSYVEIVGNGTASDARSNARTLDWNGNEVLAGKLTVGAAPTANMDVATKQYVDNAVPTATSDLTNDSGFITLADLPIYNGGVI